MSSVEGFQIVKISETSEKKPTNNFFLSLILVEDAGTVTTD